MAATCWTEAPASPSSPSLAPVPAAGWRCRRDRRRGDRDGDGDRGRRGRSRRRRHRRRVCAQRAAVVFAQGEGERDHQHRCGGDSPDTHQPGIHTHHTAAGVLDPRVDLVEQLDRHRWRPVVVDDVVGASPAVRRAVGPGATQPDSNVMSSSKSVMSGANVRAQPDRAARSSSVYTLRHRTATSRSWDRHAVRTSRHWRRGWDLNPRTTLRWSTP